MLEVFTWPAINGQKATICCELLGFEYSVRPVNIEAGAQFEPEFLSLSPNNKIPALIHCKDDGDVVELFESGAILLYLSELAGALCDGGEGRPSVLKWLMFASASLSPYLGQAYHFRNNAPEQIPYAIERYTREAQRLARVVEDRLGRQPFFAGPVFSIADIAAYPWLVRHEKLGIKLSELPNLAEWLDRLGAMDAVQRGMAVLNTEKRVGPMSPEIWEIYYGRTQHLQGR